MIEHNYDPTHCCYCGSASYSTVVAGPTVPIIKCTGCGLMRQGRMSESEINDAPSFVEYAGGVDRFRRQKIEKESAHTRDFVKISDQLDQLLGGKGRLLEIGCGMGATLNAFREKGWQVTGVEPNDWTSEQAKSNYGLDVICAPFQEAGLEPESFDAILMLHVIEHLSDPYQAIRQISDLIRPGGYLVMETPRYDTLMFRILRGRERSVIPDHLHYFTRKDMSMICRDAGFEPRQIDAVGRTLTLDRLGFYVAKLSKSQWFMNRINSMSDSLRLNERHIHINLHDMMRLYLQKKPTGKSDREKRPPARAAAAQMAGLQH